jgi:hypothetical protein
MTSRFDDLADHVDTEQGFISREIFVGADLYKEELVTKQAPFTPS